MTVMNASFAGTCTKCHQAFPVGTKIQWERGSGANHLLCPPVPVNVTPARTVPPPVMIDQSGIVKFLTDAKDRGLKFPKVRFLAPQGGELRLSLASGSSKYPGAVQIKVNDNWLGRIMPDGTVVGRNVDAAMVATIVKVAENPAAAAKAYGALMGRCSFCNLELTDAGSVEVGYGPICAKSYGLPHTAKGTPAVSAVGNVPQPTPPAPVVNGIRIIL